MAIRLTSFVEEVRNFMRDKPQLNRLLADKETFDSTISICIDHAIDFWNATPPDTVLTISRTASGVNIGGVPTQITIINYPSNCKSLLVKLTIGNILQSVLLLRNRNRMAYSDGGTNVDEESGPISGYSQLLPFYTSEIERQIIRIKMAKNMSQLLDSTGGLGSDYSWFPTTELDAAIEF